MINFLQSLFGRDVRPGSYPESLVKKAIERAVDGTDPWLRAVSGYKKKLRPSVLQAMDHVVKLVDDLSPPIAMEPGNYTKKPLFRTVFISGSDMQKILDRDPGMEKYRQETGDTAPRIFALLAMDKTEKMFLGAALSGTIVLRDVQQIAVNFLGHRLLDPAESEEESRRQLKRRAFDHLLSQALTRITAAKVEQEKLARYRKLYKSKLDLLRRAGWNFEKPGTGDTPELSEVEKKLRQIEAQLLEPGRDDRVLDVYLDILADVLGRPEDYLWLEKETLIVDSMGVKRAEASSDTLTVSYDLLRNAEGRSVAAQLVSLPGGQPREE
jgi:hypothetical protein